MFFIDSLTKRYNNIVGTCRCINYYTQFLCSCIYIFFSQTFFVTFPVNTSRFVDVLSRSKPSKGKRLHLSRRQHTVAERLRNRDAFHPAWFIDIYARHLHAACIKMRMSCARSAYNKRRSFLLAGQLWHLCVQTTRKTIIIKACLHTRHKRQCSSVSCTWNIFEMHFLCFLHGFMKQQVACSVCTAKSTFNHSHIRRVDH